jgi:hypothetical protein
MKSTESIVCRILKYCLFDKAYRLRKGSFEERASKEFGNKNKLLKSEAFCKYPPNGFRIPKIKISTNVDEYTPTWYLTDYS